MGNCASASSNITVPLKKEPKSPKAIGTLEIKPLKPITFKPVTIKGMPAIKGIPKKVKVAEPEPKLKEIFTYLTTAQTKMVEKVLAANPKIDIN